MKQLSRYEIDKKIKNIQDNIIQSIQNKPFNEEHIDVGDHLNTILNIYDHAVSPQTLDYVYVSNPEEMYCIKSLVCCVSFYCKEDCKDCMYENLCDITMDFISRYRCTISYACCNCKVRTPCRELWKEYDLLKKIKDKF